jgi:hypothetical protein
MNRPGAGAAAQAMLDSMGARTEQAAEVAGDWRELCQTLFENHAARGDLDAAAAVLTQAWRVCPEELWVQARLCRLLRLRSERGDVSGAAAWLAAAPDVYLGIGGAGTQVNELVRRQRDTVHQVARLADQVRKRQKGSGVGGEHVAEHRN